MANETISILYVISNAVRLAAQCQFVYFRVCIKRCVYILDYIVRVFTTA